MKRTSVACTVAFTLLLAGRQAGAQHVLLDLERAVPSFELEEFQPDVKWGGRLNTIAVQPHAAGRVTVATESGGLFQTTNGGRTWKHLDGFPTLRPVSVAYYPPDPRVLIATAERDFRVENGGGIWRSQDGGETWHRPAGAVPPVTPGCSQAPAAHGIAIDPISNRIYVATDCGVAISADGGFTWSHTDVPGTDAPFRAVEALGGARVVAAGDAGVYYSVDSGATFWREVTRRVGRVASYHALARSAVEPLGLYVIDAADNILYSGDGGIRWLRLPSPPAGGGGCGGVAFVKAVRDAPGSTRDTLFAGNRCGLFTRTNNAWRDFGDLDHSDTRDLGLVGANPVYLATDGGFHVYDEDTDAWSARGGGRDGLGALQVYEVTGQTVREPRRRHDLYIGTQDNNLWATGDAGATWPFFVRFEGYYIDVLRSVQSDVFSRVLYNACAGCARWLSGALFREPDAWPEPPGIPAGGHAVLGPGTYVQMARETEDGPQSLFLTDDYGSSWRHLGEIRDGPVNLPAVSAVSSPRRDHVVYMALRVGEDEAGEPIYKLVRFSRVLEGPHATRYPALADHGGIGWRSYSSGWGSEAVFAVDPHDPMHLIAPDPRDDEVKASMDGGDTWAPLPGVRDLVTQGGKLTSVGVSSLVSAVSFHPQNATVALMGGRQGGLYFSHDRGQTWQHVPGSERLTYVTSFHWKSLTEVYVSSYGRGLWRLRITYNAPVESFGAACGDPCWLADAAVPVPRPFDGQTQFQAALLVYDGSAMDVNVENGVLRGLAVTPGSSWLAATPESKPFPLTITEASTPGQFKGVEAARQLLEQGWVVKGFTVVSGKVRDVIVSAKEAVVDGPGPLIEFADTGATESETLSRQYLSAEYDGAHGVLRLTGERYRKGLKVTVLIDGQPESKPLHAGPDGSFKVKLKLKPRLDPGTHLVRAYQVDHDGKIVSDTAPFEVGTADGAGK